MTHRLALLLVAAVILGGLFLVLRPSLPARGPEARMVEVVLRGASLVPAEIVVSEGDQVTLRMASDRPTRVHLHGYDLEQDVSPGSPAVLTFGAALTGRFEIEDAISETTLGALVVQPR